MIYHKSENERHISGCLGCSYYGMNRFSHDDAGDGLIRKHVKYKWEDGLFTSDMRQSDKIVQKR